MTATTARTAAARSNKESSSSLVSAASLVKQATAKRTLAPASRTKGGRTASAAPEKMAELPDAAAKKDKKSKKDKQVRDRFTMPQQEHLALAALKQRVLALSHPVKKSELLRTGVQVLARMSDTALLKALTALQVSADTAASAAQVTAKKSPSRSRTKG